MIRSLFAAILLAPGLAHSLQLVDPVEGQNTFVKISARETTRLAVENGKIRSIIMSDGELFAEKDDERGQLFIRPLVLNKPINIRLILSSGATYNLVMQAVDIPQEDIVIRDALAKDKAKDRDAPNGRVGRSGINSLDKTVRNLLSSMAQDTPASHIDVRAMNQEMALWEGTRFVLTAQYSDRSLIGEKYRLTNVSKNQIRIVEQELYRQGVIAVAIENMQLDPRQSTNIYVVRSN